MDGSEGLGEGWDKVELGVTWFSGLVGVGKVFSKVAKIWIMNPNLGFMILNLQNLEKSFANCQKVQNRFPKCANCEIPTLRKMQFRNQFLPTLRKCQKVEKSGSGPKK